MVGVLLSYIGIPQSRRDRSVKFKNFKNSAIGCIIKRIFGRPDGPIGDLAVQAGQLADFDTRWHPVGPVSQGESGAQRRQTGRGLDPPAAERPARATATPDSSLESSAVVARPGNCVNVDIVVQGDAQQAVAQLERIGLQDAAVYRNYISGCLPVTKIDEAAAIQQVRRISKVSRSTRSGVVQGQGDYAQLSRSLRQAVKGLGIELTGKGITIGVISDSFNCNSELNQNARYVAQNGRQDTMEDDIARGDLPGNGRIRILKELRECSDGTDEGRAIAEILHDVAPGADIAFYAGGGAGRFRAGRRDASVAEGQEQRPGRCRRRRTGHRRRHAVFL